VAATDIPSAVQSLFPAGNLGTIVHDDQHVIVDSDTERMVSFMFDGALTEVIIQAAQAGKTCQELNDPAPNRSHCVVSGGLETLIWPPAGPRTSGVMVWQHGYRISAYVFAETAGASGNGSSGSASQPIPGLDTANLIRLASNQVWFD
jgi:hypothetical protein